ncbi:primosomal protein N' [Humibacter sp. BT305]|nr:primosomal protein N' [Humibacter sp. BT305]
MAASAVVARVMIESPLPQLDRLFDYLVPDSLRAEAQPGVRVKVPLRSAGRSARGYIIETAPVSDFEGSLSELDEVISPLPVLTPDVWRLARRLADRAAGSACDIVRLAVPPRFVRVEKAHVAARAAVAHADVSGADGRTSAHAPGATLPSERSPERTFTGYSLADTRALLEPGARAAVEAKPTVVELVAKPTVVELEAKPTVVELEAKPTVVESAAVTVPHWALTAAEAASAVHAGGESVIVAVPDYRDQLVLENALEWLGLAESVVRLDARQARAERYAAFLTALDGGPRIVVGNRSSVYAPVSDLGLIIVVDDSDPLQAEPLAPYVHARDAALVRQEQSGSRLLFVSVSRSTEVERLVELGFLRQVGPTPRYLPRVVPTAELGDADAPTNAARIPTAAWRTAKEALAEGPVLIQVARPGYAPVLACASCSTPASCAVCSGPLRIKRAGEPAACTLCGALAVRWSCPVCQGTTMRFGAVGSARTADELGRAFPGVRVIVADGEHQHTEVGSKPAIVVATRGAEPVAAGGYAAVLLLDGPRMLARESLRVAEDCLRWWSNAIALARPGAPTVLVGVGGPLARSLVTWQQPGFARQELTDRRALRFPPAVRLATVTGAPDAVGATLADLRGLLDPAESPKVDVLGPVPLGDGVERAVIRFDYAVGAAVARHLRALVIKNATRRRRRTGGSFSPPPTLKVRLDDSEIME